MFRRSLSIVILLVFASINLFAQKYSNEFLSIGLGARAQGMGGAMVAHISDANSGFWNPAGLTGIKSDLQVGAMHAEWFGGIGKYDYAGFGLKLKDQPRYVGFSFIRFGVDGIPNTLTLYNSDGSINYNNVTEFSAADYAFIFNYAQKFEKIGLSVGVSPKIIYRNVGKFANSWGFGADLGLQYKIKKFNFGLTLKDITTTFNSWSFNFDSTERQVLGMTGNEIPIRSYEITKPQIILGAAFTQRFNLGKKPLEEGKRQKSIGILAELDFIFTTDGKRNTLISADPISIDPAFGIELDYDNLIYLRSGINNFQRFTNIDEQSVLSLQPNFGIGVRLFSVRIDYALTNLGGNSGVLPSHIVSLLVDINYEYFKKAIKNAQ
jgi:hypothetical protein